MKNYLFAISISIASLGCTALEVSTEKNVEPTIHISLFELIMHPELQGQGEIRVRVSGYLGNRANLYLFLTKEYALLNDFSSSIRLRLDESDWNLTSSDCVEHFVSLVGHFGKDQSGDFVLSRIVQVSVPDIWGQKICWQRERTN